MAWLLVTLHGAIYVLCIANLSPPDRAFVIFVDLPAATIGLGLLGAVQSAVQSSPGSYVQSWLDASAFLLAIHSMASCRPLL